MNFHLFPSLGKLPIMIAYFKLAQSDPGLLKKKLLYDVKRDLAKEQFFKPEQSLEAGKSYTVDDLIFRMIAYSDNNAWRILLDHIDVDYLNSVVNELGAAFKIPAARHWLRSNPIRSFCGCSTTPPISMKRCP